MAVEQCPVCGGTGKYTDPPNPNVTSALVERTCHGCGGKGWVETNSCDWTRVYTDPCSGCPHKRPYTVTWGYGPNGYIGKLT